MLDGRLFFSAFWGDNFWVLVEGVWRRVGGGWDIYSLSRHHIFGGGGDWGGKGFASIGYMYRSLDRRR